MKLGILAPIDNSPLALAVAATLHFMDRGVDTGPVLASWTVPIHTGDSMESLRTRFEPVMVDLMIEGIRGVRDGRLPAAPQRREDGRQYFVLHPRLYDQARRRLADISSRVHST